MSRRLECGAGCCLIVDALDDEAWPAYSFQTEGVDLITGMPRTLEGKLSGRLPDQAEPLVLVVSRLLPLDGRMARASALAAFMFLPLTVVDSCCLLVARRCGGSLLWSIVTEVLCCRRDGRYESIEWCVVEIVTVMERRSEKI